MEPKTVFHYNEHDVTLTWVALASQGFRLFLNQHWSHTKNQAGGDIYCRCETPSGYVGFLGDLLFKIRSLQWRNNGRDDVSNHKLFNHFDTRYLVFYNTSPPRMFLSLDLLWEYWIQHGANGPLYVTSCYSTWIFCRGVSGFATDCPCDVWCRGLTTCLLHVGPPFGNRILNNSWAVGLT